MEERRREQRIRSMLRGRIVHDNRRCTLDCTIRNVSAEGAMVMLPDVRRMPEQFELVLTERDRAHRARLIWRRGESAGLALSPFAASAAGASKPKIRPQGSRRPQRRAITLGY